MAKAGKGNIGIKMKVDVDKASFQKFMVKTDAKMGPALVAAAKTGVAVAAHSSNRGYKISGIIDDVDIDVGKTPKGMSASITWKDFRAIFFQGGTSRGIKATKFKQKTQRAGRAVLIAEIKKVL